MHFKQKTKDLFLLGFLVVNLTSVYGSGILATKKQEITAPTESKNLHLYKGDLENNKNNHIFGIAINYIGGSYGPTNMPIATDGAPFETTTTPPSGSIVNIGLNWSSGIEINTIYSPNKSDGPLILMDYQYILGTNQTGGLTYPSSTTPSMFSTFPLDFLTGETQRVYSANGKYNNSGAQTGSFLFGRSLLEKGATSLFIASGLSVYYIDHKLRLNYNINDSFSDSNLYIISQKERRISGGPEVRLITRKSFTPSFGINAIIGSYAHLAYYKNSGEESYTTERGGTTYPYKIYNKIIRAIPGIEVSIGSYYTYLIKNSAALTFNAGWESGFEPSGTFLTSPVVGPTVLTPNLMAYSLLRVGATFIF